MPCARVLRQSGGHEAVESAVLVVREPPRDCWVGEMLPSLWGDGSRL
jgi:hypothetical protein